MSTSFSGTGRLRSVKLLADFFVLSGGQLISKVLSFLAFAYLARALGPEDYGSVEYALGLSVFCSMLIELGLGPVGVRELAKDPESVSRLAANIPFARYPITVAAAVIMVLAGVLKSGSPHTRDLLWILAVGLFAAPWKAEWLFQAKGMMGWAAGAHLLRMTLFAVAIFLWVRGPAQVVLVAWIDVGAAAVATLYYLGGQHLLVTPLRLVLHPPTVRYLFREGVLVGGGQMISAVNIYLPLLLVANLAAPDETGWFSAAHRVVASLAMFSLVYHFNLYPVLARKIDGPREALDSLLTASCRIVAWVSIGAALGLSLLSQSVMVLAFGEDFSRGATSLSILLWYLPVTLLSGHARWLLIAAQKQQCVLLSQVAGAATSLAIGIPSTLLWGAEGAAVSMVGGALAVWVTAQMYVHRTVRPVHAFRVAVVPLFSASTFLVVASYIDMNPWLLAPSLAVAYFGIAPLLDRRVLSCLRELVYAGSESDLNTRRDASETST